MILRANSYKNFEFGEVTLNGVAMEQVSTFKYLGHILGDSMNDDDDLMRHCRYLYAVGNSIIRKFWFCSTSVKLKLFKVYCGNIYCGHLWYSYKAASLRKLTTAYNTILRRLLNIPRFQDGVNYSAKAMFASNNILNFTSLMRKIIYAFYCRLVGSKHTVISYLHIYTKLTSIWWKQFCKTMFVN